MRGITGKSAIVTGGSRGIGKAVVDRLLQEGARGVVFVGRNPKAGAETLAEMKAKYPEATLEFIEADMFKPESPAMIVDKAAEILGEIDYLVNNAFPFNRGDETTTHEQWLNSMQAGPMAYAGMMREWVRVHGKDKPGAVTMTSSISDGMAQIASWPYNTAKGAVKQLTRCAAMDLAPNIRVNAVAPTWTRTDEIRHACPGDDWANMPDAWNKYHFLRRLAEPEEIASAVVFLLSDDASAITGHDLYVDCGYMSMGPEGLGEASSYAGTM